MSDENKLTEDQLKQIEATLKRIRGGLSRFSFAKPTEPAHVYQPEAFDDKRA
ncbi:hypothetical protein AAFN47_13870 [Hoeflea sp. CAU 1731]